MAAQCPKLYNPWEKQIGIHKPLQLATVFIGGASYALNAECFPLLTGLAVATEGGSDPGMVPLNPFYDQKTCTLKFNRCLKSDNHTWVRPHGRPNHEQTALVSVETGCAKCPRSGQQLIMQPLYHPEILTRSETNWKRLAHGIGVCVPQGHLHWWMDTANCYPNAASVQFFGKNRSPLSCIKFGISKATILLGDALVGFGPGKGIMFYAQCLIWKRGQCLAFMSDSS